MAVMIKGVDMPNECRECPLEMYYSNAGETRCRATNTILASGYKTIAFEGRHEDCPLEDVKERKGRWKFMKYQGIVAGEDWRCSECGSFQKYPTKYCPKCGAKMEKSE